MINQLQIEMMNKYVLSIKDIIKKKFVLFFL